MPPTRTSRTSSLIWSASAFLFSCVLLAACDGRIGEGMRRKIIEGNLDKELILLRSHRNVARRERLTEDILREGLARKKPLSDGVSVSAVHWNSRTRGLRPAAVIVRNPMDEPRLEMIRLLVAAPAELYPVKVFIEDGIDTREYTFRKKGTITVRLAEVAPASDRLFILWSDRAWSSGGSDSRYLGVQILPATRRDRQGEALVALRPLLVELTETRDPKRWENAIERIMSDPYLVRKPLQEAGLEVTNVSSDLWTFGTSPAALIATNSSDRLMSARVRVACHATADLFPVQVTVASASSAATYLLEGPGKKWISLPPVPAHAKQLFLVWTDKSWTPGEKGARTLGVRFIPAERSSPRDRSK